MSVELSKFDNCDTMAEAFELLIGSQESVRGTLQVASGTTKGSISICDGFIISVKINGQDLEPSVALQRLIALGESVFCLTEDPSLSLPADGWQVRITSVLDGLLPDSSDAGPEQVAYEVDNAQDVITGDLPDSAVAEAQKLNYLDSPVQAAAAFPEVRECEASIIGGEVHGRVTECDIASKEQVVNLADLLGRAISGDGHAGAEIQEADREDAQSGSRGSKAPRIEFRDAIASDTKNDPRRTYQSIKKPSISGPKITGSFSKRSLEMPAINTGEAVLPDLSTWTSTDGMTAISEDISNLESNPVAVDDALSTLQSDDLVIVNMATPQKVLSVGEEWKSAIGLDEDDLDETPPPSRLESDTIAKSEERESALTESQRELLKQVELLRDEESFNEQSEALDRLDAVVQEEKIRAEIEQAKYIVDPQTFNKTTVELRLPQDEAVLSEEQLAVAARARLDARSIEDRHDLLADAPSLDERQKELLEVVSGLSDSEGFQETDAALAAKEQLVIAESERKALENAARRLSPEQQRTEFANFEGRLVEDDNPELRAFIPYEALDQIPAPAVSDTHGPEVLPSDMDPLIAHAKDTPRPQHKGGLIGRIRDVIDRRKIAVYEGPEPTRGPNFGAFVGPSILCALCVALFTIPAMLRSSISRADSPQLAQDQMRLVVGQELNDSIPYAQHDPEAQADLPSAGMTNSVAPHVDADSSAAADSLMAARSMLARGHETAAVKEYEDYLSANPDSVPARIELINLYMRLGKKSQAKWHCLRGMKVKCAPSEFEQFWALWRQTMFN